jgi:hypothetical protein
VLSSPWSTKVNPALRVATFGVRLSDELKPQDWAGVRGQSPLWRSPRPAEIGFAGRSSEDVGRPGRRPNSAGRLRLPADQPGGAASAVDQVGHQAEMVGGAVYEQGGHDRLAPFLVEFFTHLGQRSHHGHVFDQG